MATGADRNQASATYGAGEPLALVIRAAGNLTVKGSISDGFKQGIGIAPTNIVLLPSSLSTDTVHFAAQGTALWRLVAPATRWLSPRREAGPFRLWRPVLRSAPPPPPSGRRGRRHHLRVEALSSFGTTLTRLYIPQGEEAAVTSLSLQTDPGSPPPAATSGAGQYAGRRLRSPPPSAWWPAPISSRPTSAHADDAGAGRARQSHARRSAYNSSSSFGTGQFFSVLRSGTGSLDLIAGGSFSESTPYGVSTAGTDRRRSRRPTAEIAIRN